MKKRSILIVESDQATRIGISAYVKEKHPDWQIYEAEDAFQAMDIAVQELIDFYTIDYYLPNLSGLQLIIELKRVHAAGMYVLVTSPLPDHVKTEIEALGVEHFEKPITEDVLASLLKHFEI